MKKEFRYAFLVFVVIVSVGWVGVFVEFEKKKTWYEDKEIKVTKNYLKAVQDNLTNIADLTYMYNINNQTIQQLLYEAKHFPSKQQELREKLKDYFSSTYEKLQHYGIRQLHFHLPGGVSFYRFHKPDKFGDSLLDIRYSLLLLNKTHTIQRGFEEGRVFNGYRNIYPLFYNGEFVGSVELSFSARAWVIYLSDLQKGFYALLINKEIVHKKVWQKELGHYEKTILSLEYLWDGKVLDFALKQGYLNKKELLTIEKIIAKNIHVEQHKNPFGYAFSFYNQSYFVQFFPVKNFRGKYIAYFMVLSKDNFFYENEKSFLIAGILIFLFSLSIAGIFYVFLLKNSHLIEVLKTKSNTDPLTNLLNRRGFFIAVKPLMGQLKRKKGQYSILFIDIDHFKKINDAYGHETGDKVLEILAKILNENIRTSDVVARWGGEEFVVFLSSSSSTEAYEVAQKLREIIQNYTLENIPQFRSSIGVATASWEIPINEAIIEADKALYEAKESGRNKVVVYTIKGETE